MKYLRFLCVMLLIIIVKGDDCSTCEEKNCPQSKFEAECANEPDPTQCIIGEELKCQEAYCSNECNPAPTPNSNDDSSGGDMGAIAAVAFVILIGICVYKYRCCCGKKKDPQKQLLYSQPVYTTKRDNTQPNYNTSQYYQNMGEVV